MVRYGTVELCSPTPEMREHLARWWRPECAEHFIPSGSSFPAASHVPFPGYSEGRPPRLGSLYWPNDASRWATYYQLVSGEQLDRIRALNDSSGEPNQLTISDDDSSVSGVGSVSPYMYLLTPRPVSTAEDSDESVWLICLVDNRWFWWFSWYGSVGPFIAEGMTWNEYLQSLANHVYGGSYGSELATPEAYGLVSKDRWDTKSVPFVQLLDAACAATGQRFGYSLTSGPTIWRPNDAADAQEAEWTSYQGRLLYGGVNTASQICRALPGTIEVLFDSATVDPITSTQTLGFLLGDILGGVSTADMGGVPGYRAQIYAEILADEDSLARDDYRDQAATDWYSWRLAGRVDAVFGGIIAWNISPAEMAVEWRDGTEDDGPCTVIHPWSLGDWNVYGSSNFKKKTGEIVRWVMVDGAAPVADGTNAYWKGFLFGTTTGDSYEVRLQRAKGTVFTDDTPYLATLYGTKVETIAGISKTYEVYLAGGEDRHYVRDCVDGVNGYRIWALPAPWSVSGFTAGSPPAGDPPVPSP